MPRFVVTPSLSAALVLSCAPLMLLASCTAEVVPTTPIRVRIENVAAADALTTSTGPIAFHLPPGAWATTNGASPLYALGEADRGEGLEALAEDGDPVPVAEALIARGEQAGVFSYNVATYLDGAIASGQAFVLDLDVREGEHLHLAAMLGESNDTFFSTDAAGIPLFSGGALATGDATSHLLLVDLGTEVNQPLGEGADQAPRQSAPNTGAVEGGVAREVTTLSAASFVRVTIERR